MARQSLVGSVWVCLFAAACSTAPSMSGMPEDGGSCTANLQVDSNNCGSCGRVCPNVPNALASCVAGSCAYACAPTFSDCDADLKSQQTNGCEVNTTNDGTHCGQCGQACPSSGSNTVGTCVASKCKIGCTSGYADCNSNIDSRLGDGCESDTRTSLNHCGECTNVCSTVCTAGICSGQSSPCQALTATLPSQLVAAVDGNSVAVVGQKEGRLLTGRLSTRGKLLAPLVDRGPALPGTYFDLVYDGVSFWFVSWDRIEEKLRLLRLDATLAPVGAAMESALPQGAFSGVVRYGHGALLLVAYDVERFHLARWDVATASLSAWQPLTGISKRPQIARVRDGWVLAFGVASTSSIARVNIGWQRVDTSGAVIASPQVIDFLHLAPGGRDLYLQFSSLEGGEAAATFGPDGAVLQFLATGEPVLASNGFPASMSRTGALPWGATAGELPAWVVSIRQEGVSVPTSLTASRFSGAVLDQPIELPMRPSRPTVVGVFPSAAGTLFLWWRRQEPQNTRVYETVFVETDGRVVLDCP